MASLILIALYLIKLCIAQLETPMQIKGYRNCSEYTVSIPKHEQEAIKKHTNVVPHKYLYKCLLDDYLKELSPMEDSKKYYNLSYAFSVNEILDINTEGAIKISAQIYLGWDDYRLKWDTSLKANNMSWPIKLKFPVQKLWAPIPEVFNCDEKDCAINMPNSTLASIKHAGFVSVQYKSQVDATCNISLQYFPFDRQICTFYIGILNKVGRYKFILDEEYMWSFYMDDHNEWVFSDFSISTTEYPYYMLSKNSSNPQSKWLRKKVPWEGQDVIKVTITAVRVTSYYMTNLIIPLLIINLVAIASVAFPSGSSDRPNTLLTVILAYCFFQSVVASVLPHTGEDSLIGSYLMWAMVSATAQLLVSFILVALNAMAEDKTVPPLIIRKLLIRLPKYVLDPIYHLCCCNKHKHRKKEPNQLQPSEQLTAQNAEDKVKNENQEVEEPDPCLVSDIPATDTVIKVCNLENCDASKVKSNAPNVCKHEKKPLVPQGEAWDDVADFLNWTTGSVFVTLNLVMFITYMLPLLANRFSNIFANNYFEDI